MKRTILFSLCLAFLSCSEKEANTPSEASRMVTLTEENTTPTVDIKGYKLITRAGEDRTQDAKQILLLKRNWPLVMQSPTSVGFDTILSRGFTFAGDGKLLNRAAYIEDRITPSEWKITYVQYDNLTLQFFGNTALLTYKNRVTNEHVKTKEVEIEYINWADIFVLEDGKWKIGASHTVDVRVEKR